MTNIQRTVTDWNSVPVIFDISFACRLLGKTQESVKRMCTTGQLPAFKAGKEWRIDREAFRKWMREGTAIWQR